MIRVLHCITGLTGDGAQRMLLRLTEGLSSHGIESTVVSLSPREPLADCFEELGIHVISLGVTKSIKGILDLRRLRSVIRDVHPDLLQGWMYHANVAVSLASLPSQKIPIVWNIRRGLDDLAKLKLTTRATLYADKLLARTASKIVYCSNASADQHEAFGFPADRRVVIDNGFDFARFYPRRDTHKQLCDALRLSPESILIGNVGRYDPAKDHESLIEAFAAVHFSHPDARLVLIGRGVDQNNEALTRLIERRGLGARVFLLGEQSNLERIYPALDVYCSSSISEGFPNAIAEAMASGVACVVTDAGASKELVEGAGIVTPSRDQASLCKALNEILDCPAGERNEIGMRLRDRITSRYTLTASVERYACLYRLLAGDTALQAAA